MIVFVCNIDVAGNRQRIMWGDTSKRSEGRSLLTSQSSPFHVFGKTAYGTNRRIRLFFECRCRLDGVTVHKQNDVRSYLWGGCKTFGTERLLSEY